MRAFKSFNDPNNIIVIESVLSMKSKMFINNSTYHRKATVKAKMINEDSISRDDYEPKKHNITVVAHQKEDQELADLMHILHNEHIYNEIGIPNQALEMISGTDEEAILLAYDLIRFHSYELTGSVFIE